MVAPTPTPIPVSKQILQRSFYARPTLEVARNLIGKTLVHLTSRNRLAGVIVEVEAYIGESDPACHAASGMTPRNAPLYGRPGRAYVYKNYGIHFLVNAVTESEGVPAAVLIRAVEPFDGLDVMRKRRQSRGFLENRNLLGGSSLTDDDLCRGPGNLTCAYGISALHNRIDLCGQRLFIEESARDNLKVEWTPRIGIRKGVSFRWRCMATESTCISKGR